MTVLSRRTKNNPIFVGESGVGKVGSGLGLGLGLGSGLGLRCTVTVTVTVMLRVSSP